MIMVVLEVLVIHSTRYGFFRISALGFKRISFPSFSFFQNSLSPCPSPAPRFHICPTTPLTPPISGFDIN